MKKVLMAVPKGRILEDIKPLFNKINIVPEKDFFDSSSRKLVFKTNLENLDLVQVRSFDVATFVKYGAADIGICGFDVLEEFSSKEIFSLLDLGIGKCRLSIASKKSLKINIENQSHVRVATKYVNIAQNYFSNLGIQVEAIKLNGSIEIAPQLGLCDFIMDLVSSGKTLVENDMVELRKIMDVTSHLIVNRTSFKTGNSEINRLIEIFNGA
ncbi:MAG: ATP phosphoribosyltransferase [Pelagibacterales bacterium]|nr:ATP phosphoribosyltransferase [Pelagibacterales bacterium]